MIPASVAASNQGSTFSGWAMWSMSFGRVPVSRPASRTARMPALSSSALRVQLIGRAISPPTISGLVSLPTWTSSGISPSAVEAAQRFQSEIVESAGRGLVVEADPGGGGVLLVAVGPVVGIMEVEQHLQAGGAGAADGALDVLEVGVAGPGRVVPQPHPDEIAAARRHQGEGIDLAAVAVAIDGAAILHLVHIGQVGAEIEAVAGREGGRFGGRLSWGRGWGEGGQQGNKESEQVAPYPPCRRRRWGGGPSEGRWRGKLADGPSTAFRGPPPHALRAQGGKKGGDPAPAHQNW